MPKKIIVVGLSAASTAFVTKLRSFDKESDIICFSGEQSAPYNRCLLADFLVGDNSFDQIRLKQQDFFELHNIQVKLGTWVTKINTQEKYVAAGGQHFFYDYLFLGVGTKPFLPPWAQNLDMQGVFTFHTFEDMQNILAFVSTKKPARAMVIGAGLNGIEAVSCLHALGLSVTLVEAAATILPAQADTQVASHIVQVMLKKGIVVYTGCRVEKMLECHGVARGSVRGVQLASGEIIEADMVIMTTGSAVNLDLLADTGIATEQGSIVVDEHMQTNVPGVMAGGDVCRVKDMVSGALRRSTTWSDALLQGLKAATTVSATPQKYPGIVGLQDSYFFGTYFYACGITKSDDGSIDASIQTRVKVDSVSLTKLYFKDGVLIGFVLFGDISRLADYRQWYLTQQSVDINSCF